MENVKKGVKNDPFLARDEKKSEKNVKKHLQNTEKTPKTPKTPKTGAKPGNVGFWAFSGQKWPKSYKISALYDPILSPGGSPKSTFPGQEPANDPTVTDILAIIDENCFFSLRNILHRKTHFFGVFPRKTPKTPENPEKRPFWGVFCQSVKKYFLSSLREDQ